MAFPLSPLNVKVELALGANLTADPGTWTWTDITSQVLHRDRISITRGRANEQSQAEPSKATLTLKNTNGQFVPRNPNSPYYGQLRKNTPLRVQVAPDFTRFTGFVSEWPPRWDASGKDKYVTIEANGILRRLSQGKAALESAIHRATTGANLLAYWPLEDNEGAVQGAASLPNVPPVIVAGDVNFGSESTLLGSEPLPTVQTSQGNASLLGAVPQYATTDEWAVTCFYRLTTDITAATTLLEIRTAAQTWRVIVTNGSPDTMYLRAYDSTTGAELPPSGAVVQATVVYNQWTALTIQARKSGADTSWLVTTLNGDGAGVGFSNTIAGVLPGVVRTIEVPATAQLDGGSFGHLAVWSLENATYNRALWKAINGYSGESALGRIARLSTEERVPITSPAYEDFEDATLNLDIASSVNPWARTNSFAHSGSWSYKSAAIGNNATSSFTINVPAGSKAMGVWYKVSSEAGFDYFRILRDGVEEFKASGEVDWTQHTVNVDGVKQVTFSYTKDAAVVGGLDAAFIDDLTFSSETVGAQTADTFLNLIRECEAADGGVLYETTDGRLAYLPGYARYNAPVGLALDYTQGDVAPPLEPTDDDQNLSNDWTVERKGGSKAQVTDQAHIDANGRYDSSVTINVATDIVLPDHAGWRGHLGTNDEIRYPSLTLDLAARPTLIADWLASDVGTRTTVSNPPVDIPPDTIDLFIEGYTETLGFYDWTVRANCSPAKPWTVGVLDSAILGKLDTDGSVLAAGAASNATTIDVAVTDGPLWTTSVAEFPFDIECDGERMTVTGIANPTVTFVSAGTAAHTSGPTGATPGLPAGMQQGDLMLVWHATGPTGWGGVSPPAGYTMLYDGFNQFTNTWLYGKIHSGTESAPTVFGGQTGDTVSAQMVAFRGPFHNINRVFYRASDTGLDAANQNIQRPGLNIEAPNILIFSLGYKRDDWTSVATIPGTTEIGEPSTALVPNQGIVWAWEFFTSPGIINPFFFTVTGGAAAQSRGAVVALQVDKQTFTVTRSVNGVVKAHNAGAAVSLWTPLTLAL